MTELVFLQPGGSGKSTYSESTVWSLALALSRVSAMDPADVLKRLSAGDEILPKFDAENLERDVKLPSFRDLQHAKVGKLSDGEYESFLGGKAPSATHPKEMDEGYYTWGGANNPFLPALKTRYVSQWRSILDGYYDRRAAVMLSPILIIALGSMALWFFTSSNWAQVTMIGAWGALLGAAVLRIVDRWSASRTRQLPTHELDLARAMMMAENRDEDHPLRDHSSRNM